MGRSLGERRRETRTDYIRGTGVSWRNAAARDWTMRTFAGGHSAQPEDPRGVATFLVKSVHDQNKSVVSLAFEPGR